MPSLWRRYPDSHRHLELPEGVVDLAANIPERTVHLLATTANLVSSPDLHPAVVDLMLLAATEVHKEGGLVSKGRTSFHARPCWRFH